MSILNNLINNLKTLYYNYTSIFYYDDLLVLQIPLTPLPAVMVWLQYAQFAMDNLSAVPEGLAFPREVFERAIVACGLHIGQSGLIWDAYVALELAILSSLQVSGISAGVSVSSREGKN